LRSPSSSAITLPEEVRGLVLRSRNRRRSQTGRSPTCTPTVIAQYPSVERIVCGHVHREMQLRFAGTVLCTAPSTTTAIALRSRPTAEPASFIEPPGFLLHHWKPGTGLLTHSIPIGAFPGPFPFA
jgi:hypothetical protein